MEASGNGAQSAPGNAAKDKKVAVSESTSKYKLGAGLTLPPAATIDGRLDSDSPPPSQIETRTTVSRPISQSTPVDNLVAVTRAKQTSGEPDVTHLPVPEASNGQAELRVSTPPPQDRFISPSADKYKAVAKHSNDPRVIEPSQKYTPMADHSAQAADKPNMSTQQTQTTPPSSPPPPVISTQHKLLSSVAAKNPFLAKYILPSHINHGCGLDPSIPLALSLKSSITEEPFILQGCKTSQKHIRGIPTVYLKNERERKWILYLASTQRQSHDFVFEVQSAAGELIGHLDSKSDVQVMKDDRWKLDISRWKAKINNLSSSRCTLLRVGIFRKEDAENSSKPIVVRQVMYVYRVRLSDARKSALEADEYEGGVPFVPCMFEVWRKGEHSPKVHTCLPRDAEATGVYPAPKHDLDTTKQPHCPTQIDPRHSFARLSYSLSESTSSLRASRRSPEIRNATVIKSGSDKRDDFVTYFRGYQGKLVPSSSSFMQRQPLPVPVMHVPPHMHLPPMPPHMPPMPPPVPPHMYNNRYHSSPMPPSPYPGARSSVPPHHAEPHMNGYGRAPNAWQTPPPSYAFNNPPSPQSFGLSQYSNGYPYTGQYPPFSGSGRASKKRRK